MDCEMCTTRPAAQGIVRDGRDVCLDCALDFDAEQLPPEVPWNLCMCGIVCEVKIPVAGDLLCCPNCARVYEVQNIIMPTVVKHYLTPKGFASKKLMRQMNGRQR